MDLLSKKYRQAEEISNLKAEIERLKALCETYRTCYQAKHSDIKCLLPKYLTTLQEIKVICDYENEYNSIGIDDYKRMIKDIVNLITKTEVE